MAVCTCMCVCVSIYIYIYIYIYLLRIRSNTTSCVLCSDHVLDILVIYCGVSSPCKSHILLCVPQREGWGLG